MYMYSKSHNNTFTLKNKTNYDKNCFQKRLLNNEMSVNWYIHANSACSWKIVNSLICLHASHVKKRKKRKKKRRKEEKKKKEICVRSRVPEEIFMELYHAHHHGIYHYLKFPRFMRINGKTSSNLRGHLLQFAEKDFPE